MNHRKSQKQLKICVIGSSNVGKSSLLLRYTEDYYDENYQATIGIDFKFKQMTYKEESIRLALWDTAGQEKFQTITKAFY
jgi:small GTP-binding protein